MIYEIIAFILYTILFIYLRKWRKKEKSEGLKFIILLSQFFYFVLAIFLIFQILTTHT